MDFKYITFLLGMLTPAGRCCNYNNEHEIFFSVHSHSKVATYESLLFQNN